VVALTVVRAVWALSCQLQKNPELTDTEITALPRKEEQAQPSFLNSRFHLGLRVGRMTMPVSLN